MSLLARFDPGAAAPVLAASTAAAVAVVAIVAEALGRLLRRRGSATRHEVDLVALLIVLASPASRRRGRPGRGQCSSHGRRDAPR